ncbi:MAG: 50S ribosomal protein L3 [Waddliaceae bacterium]|jgi:large subunit ribosomal protein L3|nr:50S ribosomal protein L3 [Waddliaceae bacterium]MBT3578660.1 50S ribosomal protein L3 [Waddliaceae bacterium]MBT4445379.1 50S ribosomal protein L3 [Waddliaceae bacterium]MBT6928353.1 50S ribosomal protein L3 [Waddliaceae bacterium]MBT7265039.1 50S ribosomal protein L3 [Waddliaceae bacterium]
MTSTLMGKKKGMTQLFDDKGRIVPCTVIHCEPNVIAQIKTKENDGYSAIQLGYDKVVTKDRRTKETRVGKPLMGHFKKAAVEPRRQLHEVRVDTTEEFSLGQELTVEVFADVKHVDVTAISKGKGTQGVIKVHNFKGGPASHGSHFHRRGGSTGMCSSPGIVLPGTKKARRLGNAQVTTQNVKVVRIDVEKNILIVKGAVPGHIGREILIQKAVKKGA